MKETIKKIEKVARECADIMLSADREKADINEKTGNADLVTKYDKMIQEKLKKDLHEILPEATFVGEEEDIHAAVNEGYAFIVDPIDGTTNFIKDYHASCVSIGIAKDGKPFAGVIYNPYLDEMFTAVKGQGAYLNEKKITVSAKTLEKGIVLFGTSPYYEDLSKKSFEMAYDYFKHSLDIRRSGSAALDLCSIAAGRAELYFELKLSPWDYAAGAIIVMEAGGVITKVDGSEITLDKPCSILASNGKAVMDY